MVTALIAKKQFYKIIKQSIKRVIILIKVFFIGLLLYKYLYYLIIKYFILVI